jgi:hypothetical protein
MKKENDKYREENEKNYFLDFFFFPPFFAVFFKKDLHKFLFIGFTISPSRLLFLICSRLIASGLSWGIKRAFLTVLSLTDISKRANASTTLSHSYI